METLSTLLLVRFGLVAGAVVLVAVAVFAAALVLRRRGRLDDARRRMEPVVRAAARAAVDRYTGTPRPPGDRYAGPARHDAGRRAGRDTDDDGAAPGTRP
ncbi:hypothetical protein LEP48_17825 [Isoptericola sp. NEAU-Y5]|uniref:Uncharacterized protein n=1 Tax=Isoptericola luteus TaxID=2879484 RepID=A0ABS7ZLG9_9MICO|nr:hypothetical protein [Isoptericola sp. NEAU-Y5]MCA5895191.1 hypothetical protein [Isoptericola sp. NEAU-Y5]